MIVDFEHHYIPAELPTAFGSLSDAERSRENTRATVHSQLFDLEVQLCDMDRVGIDIAVQSCILGWEPPSKIVGCSTIAARGCSKSIQAVLSARMRGFGRRCRLEEVERAVARLGLKGVTISSQVNGLSLDAEEYWAVFPADERLGVPIFVHPALSPKAISLMQDYLLPVILTRDFNLGLVVTRLIAGGVVERYPDLQFVFAHFGGGPGIQRTDLTLILSIQAAEIF